MRFGPAEGARRQRVFLREPVALGREVSKDGSIYIHFLCFIVEVGGMAGNDDPFPLYKQVVVHVLAYLRECYKLSRLCPGTFILNQHG